MSLRTLTSQVTCKKALAASALLGLGLAATGCQMDSAVISSGGKSFTVAPGTPGAPSPSALASSQPASPAVPPSPAPTVTVTQAPAPLPIPSATAQVATADVGTCLPPVITQGWLYSLATAAPASALAQCLGIPQPNQAEFETQVAFYAGAAAGSGEFRTGRGRQDWTGTDGYVVCPDGRVVYSLIQIDSQYS